MTDKYKAGYWPFQRKNIEGDVFLSARLLKLWTLCMNSANWQENSVRLDGVADPVKLKPGQFITGRSTLHGEYHRWRLGYQKRHPAPYTLWRWLKTLEKMGYVSIKSTNKYSIITLHSWEKKSPQNRMVDVSNKTPKSEQLEVYNITQYPSHMSSNVTNKTAKSEQQDEHREEVYKNKEGVKKKIPILPFRKKDKGDSRSCEACRKSFIPTKHYHTVCDACYEPGVKAGARPELLAKKCKGCGLEASNVIDGFCPFCEGKESNKS